MSEPEQAPKLREHFAEVRRALHGIGKDIELDVADSPHLAKEGAKNALATAAGIRKKPMKEWGPTPPSDGP
jgi:hypothetical protein